MITGRHGADLPARSSAPRHALRIPAIGIYRILRVFEAQSGVFARDLDEFDDLSLRDELDRIAR